MGFPSILHLFRLLLPLPGRLFPPFFSLLCRTDALIPCVNFLTKYQRRQIAIIK